MSRPAAELGLELGERQAAAAERQADALERIADIVELLAGAQAAADADDMRAECPRCKGRRQWAPGVPCETCHGEGVV